MKTTLLAAAPIVLGLSLCAPAFAGRPLVTEDAGVLDRGACEIESFLSRASARGVPRLSGLSLQFGCGVGLGTQAALALAHERAAGETARALAFVGKTSIVDGGADKTSYTLAWGAVSVKPPGGSMKHEDLVLNGVASTPLGDAATLHANLGWTRTRSTSQHTVNWNLALERGLSGGVDVMGEVYADNRDRNPWLAVGLRWHAVPEKLFLDTSYALQTASARPRLFTVGLKAAF